MQGTIQNQKCGYHWKRIGYAEKRFSRVILFPSLGIMIILAVWTYAEIPPSEWRLVNFIAIYFTAALLYMNLGVWLHEQLHCLAFLGATPRRRTKITYTRKNLFFLNGHYRVYGSIKYKVMNRALLAPSLLSIGLILIGFLGRWFMPGWWLPVLLTMATAGIIDMTHDLYMVSQICSIGEKGKYWDLGHYLEVVWKE